MSKHLKCFLKIIPVILLVVLFIFWIAWVILDDGVYETEDVSDYGVIKGNENNSRVEDIVFSFFPDHIDHSFSNITYRYKALKNADHAFECYLEFVIEDPSLFAAFLEEYVDQEKASVFQYDEVFMDYTITNQFDINPDVSNNAGGYQIEYAVIEKVIYSEEEQRIIFFALGLWDGGLIWTTDLDTFFSRFNIDVTDYWLNAYCSPTCEETDFINAKHRYE